MHRYAGRADRMTFRFQAARRINRQLTVFLRPSFFQGTRPFTRFGQTHRFIFHEFGHGEAIVRLHHAKVVECQLPVGQGIGPRIGTTFEL